MSLNIQKNLVAYKVSHNVQTTVNNLSKSIERLSTGSRLNSAADDPVAMTQHNLYRSRIDTLNKGIENSTQAISLLQTAESSVSLISDKLIRMKELAEQAATGTYTNEQRFIIQSEFASMASEIDMMARSTNYNNILLLDSSLSAKNYATRNGSWVQADKPQDTSLQTDSNLYGLQIHYGEANSRISDYSFIRIEDFSMNGLLRNQGDPKANAASKIAVSSQHAAQIALSMLESAMQVKERNRAFVSSMQNHFQSTLDYLESQVLNITDADSKISDVDYADEMTNLVSYQTLSQAATAMLTQANILPQIALKLLG